MEEDRAATNLGPGADDGISEEPTVTAKQPRRRFVGRKTAEKAGEQQGDPNANIEDSSVIQGVRRLTHMLSTRED
jgi:2-(3-amino-3-carboxypropyl)histidine synthase